MPSFRERLRAVRPGRPETPPDDATVEIVVAPADLPEEPPGAVLVQAGEPPASVVRAARRERAELERRLAQLREDLGGLAIEMARRDRFNHSLLERRAGEAVAVERAIHELDARVAATGLARNPIDAEGMEETLVTAPVTVLCTRCGAGLIGDVNFCGYCGAPRGDG
jgi:Tfp pilus assembly protein FimV